MTAPTVEKTIEEIASSPRCVACGAPHARPARPVLEPGFSARDLDDYVPWIPLCADCAHRQMEAERMSVGRVVVVSLPSVVLVACVTLLPIGSIAEGALALIVTSALTYVAGRWTLAARHPPVTVVRGAGSRLNLRLDVEDDPARKAATRARSARALTLLGAVIAVFTGGAAWRLANPEVGFDNATATTMDVWVESLGEASVTPRRRAVGRVRFGRHAVTTSEGEATAITVEWGASQVIAVGGPLCYEIRRGDQRTVTGRVRMVAVDNMQSARRVPCD